MTIVITARPQAGSSIEDVARELVDLARRVGVPVEAAFNDVRLFATPAGDADRLVAGWHDAVKPGVLHKFAHSG